MMFVTSEQHVFHVHHFLLKRLATAEPTLAAGPTSPPPKNNWGRALGDNFLSNTEHEHRGEDSSPMAICAFSPGAAPTTSSSSKDSHEIWVKAFL